MRLTKRLENNFREDQAQTLLEAETLLQKARSLGADNNAVVELSPDRLGRFGGPAVIWVEEVE